MRIGCDGCNTFGGFHIAHGNYRFKRSTFANGITVHFYKSVYHIYAAVDIGNPCNIVFIPFFQVSGFVILHQQLQCFALFVVFGNCHRFFKPKNNTLNSLTIHAAHFPYFLCYVSVFLHHLRVQSPRHRCWIIFFHACSVVCFHFSLRYAFIKIVGRCFHIVNTCRQIYNFGIHFRIENDGRQCADKFINRFTIERKQRRIHTFYHTPEIIGTAGRHKFIFAVMVVNTVREKYPFGIHLNCFPIFAAFFACVVFHDGFKQFADTQVVFILLIVNDIATGIGCFIQVVSQFFLRR